MEEWTWPELAAGQAGMLSQRQLNTLGVRRGFVRNQLRARRWSQRTSSVLSVTTGPLTRDQRLWLATLHAGPTALLGGLTAAELHGLRGWHRDVVTVLVDDELSFEPLDGVRFFRSRRPWPRCGRRWTDAEWDLTDGRVLVLEVDGGYHDDVLQATEDRVRHRRLTSPDRIVVACTAYELRHDAGSVMADLIALGVPRIAAA
jgi:hypothetical protein